jgi:hypothetical protein
MKWILILTITISTGLAQAQNHNKILLVNGYLHTGNGDIMESALIGIEGGKISMIQNSLAYTYVKEEWDTIIELNGQHIYPGFVAPNSTLGLTEIDAVRATRDYREVGTFNPHIRSQIAFNVESKVISTVRTNGVLMAQATPRGGRISGTSAVMKLDGWNWEDATVSANDGIHINWPSAVQGVSRWSKGEPKKSEKYEKQKEEIYDFFDMSIAYSKKNENTDNRLEAMRDCFDGKKRVFFHASELQQLLDIIEISHHYDLKYPVIVGGYDAHLITRQLSDAHIPVMIQRTHSLPENEDDDVDLPYKLPFLLKEGGVKFCLQNEGDMEAMNARNIPFLAGTARAYGLAEEDAVSAVSLWTCEILGTDKNYGSIEKGKSATLFVSSGDALDIRTNNVTLALIDGKFMSLTNSQKELYEKYSNKYESEK